jgi:hypothetical protein
LTYRADKKAGTQNLLFILIGLNQGSVQKNLSILIRTGMFKFPIDQDSTKEEILASEAVQQVLGKLDQIHDDVAMIMF